MSVVARLTCGSDSPPEATWQRWERRLGVARDPNEVPMFMPLLLLSAASFAPRPELPVPSYATCYNDTLPTVGGVRTLQLVRTPERSLSLTHALSAG